MSEENKKNENKTKSLDELLSKKKTNTNADENDNMRSKMNRLKKANSVFDDTKPTFSEDDTKVKALEEEKKKLEKDLALSNKQLKALYALKYQDVKLIDKKNNALTKEIEAKLNACDLEKQKALEEKVKGLEKDLKELNKKLKAEQEEKAKLEDYVKGMSTALNKTKEEKEKNDKEVENINSSLNDAKNELEANKTAVVSLNERIEQLNKEKEELLAKEDLFKEREKEINDINQKLEKANLNKEKQNEKINTLNDKNKQLSEELKQAKVDNKQLSKDISTKEKELTKLQAKIDTLNEKLNNTISEKDALSKELEEANKKANELEEKNNTLLDVTSGLSQEFRNYEVKDVNDASTLEKLNAEIEKLNSELELKNKEIENLKSGLSPEDSQRVDELIQELDSKEFEISHLNDEKNELQAKVDEIPALNDKINELTLALDAKEEEFQEFKKLHDNEDSAIDASVYDELREIQNECDQANADLEEAKKEKAELEKELEIAYKALQDQEEILNEQQEILETQQLVIDKKMDDYLRKEQDFKEKEKEFEKELAAYNQDREEYEAYRAVSSAKQDDIFKNENDFAEIQKQLDDAKAEIEKLTYENNQLKEEKKKTEEVIKQYLDDIHTSEARIDDLVDTLAHKEVDLDNYKAKLASLQSEFEDFKDIKNQKEQELENELERLRDQLNNISSDNEKLSIAKFNESRLQSRIFELENNIKILSLKQDNNQENTLVNSLDQYRNLLANERDAHKEAEDKLTNDLNNLKDQFNKLNEKMEKYSSNYYYIALSKQVSSLNKIIDDIKNNNVDINRDIYNKYYEDAIKINLDSNQLFQAEIEKRNELLSKVKAEKEQELQELSQEPDSNQTNSLIYNKIRLLYKQIRDIDLLLNSQIKTAPIISSEEVEEEILKAYKKKLITYHRQMENNIKNLEKNFADKYDSIDTLDKLIETYDNDCKEMANGYANEISKLSNEDKFDDNPLSKIIREEKILLLANEFQTLVNIRDNKYNDSLKNIQNTSKTQTNENYNSSLVSFDALKQNLEEKMSQIESEAKEAKAVIVEEQRHIEEDIQHLSDQLEQLNSFDDEKIVAEDRKKVKVLLAGKQERLDYLTNIKTVETEKHYDELLNQIKIEYNEVIEDEAATKTIYEKRNEDMAASRKLKANTSNNDERLKTYEAINNYLLDFNNIDEIFDSIINERKDLNKSINEAKEQEKELKSDALEFSTKYKNLWKLYDRYISAKKTMEEDVEDIRTYMTMKIEASGAYRKYVAYQKSLVNLEERIKMGLDVNKNNELLRVNTAKSNTLKNRVDYLNNQASELLKNQNVSAYVELTNKIDEIVRLIKQMDTEFQKYIK